MPGSTKRSQMASPDTYMERKGKEESCESHGSAHICPKQMQVVVVGCGVSVRVRVRVRVWVLVKG